MRTARQTLGLLVALPLAGLMGIVSVAPAQAAECTDSLLSVCVPSIPLETKIHIGDIIAVDTSPVPQDTSGTPAVTVTVPPVIAPVIAPVVKDTKPVIDSLTPVLPPKQLPAPPAVVKPAKPAPVLIQPPKAPVQQAPAAGNVPGWASPATPATSNAGEAKVSEPAAKAPGANQPAGAEKESLRPDWKSGDTPVTWNNQAENTEGSSNGGTNTIVKSPSESTLESSGFIMGSGSPISQAITGSQPARQGLLLASGSLLLLILGSFAFRKYGMPALS